MRYWPSNLNVAVFLLLCGMAAGIVGCTKAPANKEPDVKTDKIAKVEKEVRPKLVVVPDSAPKEPDTREIFGDAPIVNETPEPAAKEPDVKEPDEIVLIRKPIAVIDVETKGPTELTAQESPKKEKSKAKEKEPGKDKSKEPKIEFKEPSEVAGKTFSEWLKQMKSPDPLVREEAMKHVTAFGPNKSHEALPDIIFQLNRHKTVQIDLAVRVNGILALSTVYKQMALAKKEPDAKLHKEAYALYKMFLKDEQVIMRVRAVQGLPYLGPIARDAIEDVIKLCKDPITWEVRKEALQTLTMIAKDAEGEVHPKVMPELRLAMKDSAYIVRQTAAQALAIVNTPKVMPELWTGLANDKSPPVRLTILNVLAMLGPALDNVDRPIVVKKLEAHLLAEPDPILNIWTHATIMTVSKSVSEKHIAPIVKRLKESRDPAVRVQALNVIALGGEKAKVLALKEVVASIYDSDPSVAVAAINCVVQLHATEAIPILEKIEADKKSPEYLRDAAARALDSFHDLKAAADDKAKKDKDNKTPDKK